MNQSLFVLLRHGHRAPSQSFGPILNSATLLVDGVGSTKAFDHEKWASLTLKVDKDYLDNYTKRFPIISADYNPVPSDEVNYPFGFLTNKGAGFVKQQGSQFASKYSTFLEPILQSNDPNVHIVATNYCRTQITTQYFLDGMVPQNFTSPLMIHVLLMDWCPMTFYDSYPKVAVPLVRKTVQTERYRAAESTPEVQKAMTAMLKEFPVISQNKYGFNWPLAHDYFACHRGHNISMPPYLIEHEDNIYKQFIFRYYHYYFHDMQHRAVTAGPVLASLLASFNTSTPRLTLFGGHDINIFAVLCALNLAQDPWSTTGNAHTQVPPLWPPFGSSLVFRRLDEQRVHLRYSYDQTLENTIHNNEPMTTNKGNWDTVSATEAEVTLSINSLEDTLAELRSEHYKIKEEYSIQDQRW